MVLNLLLLMKSKGFAVIKNKKLFAFVFSLTLLFDLLVSSILGRSVEYSGLALFAVLFLILGWSLGVGEARK